MRQASKRVPDSAEKTVRDIRRATRRHHSAEEKIRIVLEGLRGEDSIAELCRKEGINQNIYYRWSFLALAAQLSSRTLRGARKSRSVIAEPQSLVSPGCLPKSRKFVVVGQARLWPEYSGSGQEACRSRELKPPRHPRLTAFVITR